jgi:hypothetical protein
VGSTRAGYRGIDFDSGNRTQWYVRGVGRYFPTDNIRLEGEIGFAQDGFDGSGTTIDTLFWSATAEYRFDHMPLGIYAQYRGANFQVESNLLNNVNMAVLGVRAHLGSDSLFDNDRRGASFDTHVPDLWIAPSPEGK